MSIYANVYYQDSCAASIPALSCDPCSPKEKARVRSLGFLNAKHTLADPSLPAQWTDAVLNSKAYILPFVAGKVTMEPVKEKGYGDIEEILVGYKFKVEVEEPNYAANALFWNAMKNSKNQKCVYRTESKIHISTNPVSIVPMAPVEDDLNKNVVWKIEISWTQEGICLPIATPAGIFDACFTPV